MGRCCLPFIAGAALISLLPALPDESLRYALIPLVPFAALPRRSRPVAAALAGAVLYWSAAAAVLADRLPRAESGNDFNFEAYIVDFAKEKSGRLTFVVAPLGGGLPRRVRLSWYDAEARPAIGERWQFRARLKRPRGGANPGGFDYAGWLHRERIGADGYVRRAERRAVAGGSAIVQWRRRAVLRLTGGLPAGDARAALLAIAVGARHEISDATWQRYAVTGTSHLMAVSGLHVGLAAVAAGFAGWGLLGVVGCRRNLRDAAAVVAVPVAGLYAALAGLAVPAQRALLMTVAAAALLLARRVPRPLPSLALVAVLVLVIDPLALLAPGFLLSFGAVAVLLLAVRGGSCRHTPGALGRLRRAATELGNVQLALLLGLFPLTAGLFDRVAWLAPLVNFLVVPVFSLVTVPAALAGLVLDGPLRAAGDAVLGLAWCSLRVLHGVIDVAAALPGAAVTLAEPSGPALLVFLLPVCGLLLPRGCPGRRLGWLALAWALAFRPPPPPAGCVDVHTLDVGQGLAQVVQTPRHALLYDTGPAWRASNSAERIVLPFLAARGIRRLDRIVVSHADNDHAGGIAAIAGHSPGQVLAGEPLDVPVAQRPCRRGQRFEWDGIAFRFLHPGSTATGNDASCVLEIAAGRHRALLTGDIESGSERLLAERGELRPAVLVGVPHHGSRTSSSAPLVAAVTPTVAVVSAGFDNRWGFPDPGVVDRWRAVGAEIVTTASAGAMQHRICRDGGLETIRHYRDDARRYWHDAVD